MNDSFDGWDKTIKAIMNGSRGSGRDGAKDSVKRFDEAMDIGGERSGNVNISIATQASTDSRTEVAACLTRAVASAIR